MFSTLLFIFAVAAIIYVITRPKYRFSNIPPGPPKYFPLFGHLPQIGAHPHKTFLRWKEKYGPIFALQFGGLPTVVINDGELIRKVGSSPSLNGRPYLPYYDECVNNRAGFIWRDCSDAAPTRSFIQKQLRGFGLGSKSMEARIQEQVHNFVEGLKERARTGTPVEVKNLFSPSILKYIWSLTVGQDSEPSQDRIDLFSGKLSRVSEQPPALILALFIPKLTPILSPFLKASEYTHEAMDYIEACAEEHRPSRVPGQSRDMVDAFLDHGATLPQDKNHLKTSIFEILGAAIETTSRTLEWCLYFLLRSPEIRLKLDAELERVVGSDRLPCVLDRPNMPYIEAFITEVLRKITIVPFGIFHAAEEDTNFQGYLIPKGTMVLTNFYASNNDPAVWGDPENFRPERFLSENGQLIKTERFMGFGSGKRACIGETLARHQLFLYLATLLQKFQFEACGPLPKERDGTSGVSFSTKNFSIWFSLRCDVN